jgi:hypothetical protein
MTIKYREGRVHTNADPLSRAPLPECDTITVLDTPQDFTDSLVEGYARDPYFQRVLEGITSTPPSREFDHFSHHRAS